MTYYEVLDSPPREMWDLMDRIAKAERLEKEEPQGGKRTATEMLRET